MLKINIFHIYYMKKGNHELLSLLLFVKVNWQFFGGWPLSKYVLWRGVSGPLEKFVLMFYMT